MATKYRKKTAVEAMKFTDRNDVEGIALWGAPILETDALAWNYGLGAYIKRNGRLAITGVGGMHPGCLILMTPDGDALVEPGDYIVLESPAVADRKFYPCKPDIFEATYELATLNVGTITDTVRPNPDDTRQVETVARALFLHSMGQEAAPAWDAPTDTGKGAWLSRARAVLTALAALGGGRS